MTRSNHSRTASRSAASASVCTGDSKPSPVAPKSGLGTLECLRLSLTSTVPPRRELTHNRGEICSQYSKVLLAPLTSTVDRNALYSGILTEDQQRLAFQYLEAQRLEKQSGGNITKRTISALILCVLNESAASIPLMTRDQILEALTAILPNTNQQRLREIVNGRLQHLVNNKTVNFDKPSDRYTLSADQSAVLEQHLTKALELDKRFRVALASQIDMTCTEREVDYKFSRPELAEIGHLCLLWHMKVQADRFIDPFEAVSNIMFADKLVAQYIAKVPLSNPTKAIRDALNDVLPHALFTLVTSRSSDVQQYLRSKSDLMILQASLQVTPDIREACRGLIGQDIVYLDSSVLIRCVAEIFGPQGHGPLTQALRYSRSFNTKLRVLRTHIDELVSHLRGPVLLEWENHMASSTPQELEPQLWSAPTLINVFYESSIRLGRSVSALVRDIIGQGNEWENTKEFLVEELGVTVEEPESPEDNDWWKRVFGVWLDNKRRSPRLTIERFELLVRNDVNAFTTIVQLRKHVRVAGDNYGHKVWLLTFDSMFWRIGGLLNERQNHALHVGMSIDYLINYVSTAAQAGIVELPNEVLPAILLLDETETSGSGFRDIVVEKWSEPGEKKYMRERRLRDLVHDLKGAQPELGLDEGLEAEVTL